MRSKLLGLLILVIAFTSCQKDVDWANTVVSGSGGSGGTGGSGGPNATANGITGGSNGTLIVRAVRKNNVDSVVALIDYNAANKFIKYVCVGREKYDTFDIDYNIYRTFVRDAAGRITNVVAANTLDTTFFGPVDSIRSVVHYPSATSTEFDYVVTKADMGIANFIDSNVYTYTGGRVTRIKTYSSNDLLPAPPELSSQQEYTYDAAGNVKEIKQYQEDPLTGQLKLTTLTTYTYDNKPSTYEFKNEGFLMSGIYYGPNNIVSGKMIQYQTSPATTNLVSFAYNYNAQGHPMNGQMAANNPNRTFTLTFYYK